MTPAATATLTLVPVDIEANARRDAAFDIDCCGAAIALRYAWAKMQELLRRDGAWGDGACARYRRAYIDAVLEKIGGAA